MRILIKLIYYVTDIKLNQRKCLHAFSGLNDIVLYITGRGWQDKVRDPNKRRRWKRPKSYRLKGRNKKQRLRQKSGKIMIQSKFLLY